MLSLFNPIQDGGEVPLPVFPLQLLQTYGLVPKTLWLLVLTLLPHLCKISSLYLTPVPNYWTWTKTTSLKKQFFWLNSNKIEVVVTSLIEMLQLPNFGHRNTSTIWFESRGKILLVRSSKEIMTSYPLFQNTVI